MPRRTNHLMTGHLKTKMTIIGVFVAIFWIVEILDQFVFDHQLNQYEIISSSLPFGLRWILFAPFLHGSFKDLIVGTIGFVILGLSVMSYKIRHFWIVTIITMIVGGLGIWRFNPYDPHPIGASILIFG
jgi:membrane associated rhomboid family serine protease